jgi:4,5-DOPA dioxygenase extradiol
MISVDAEFPISESKMPVLFVGHGSPMNALEDNEYSQAWEEAGRSLPRPRAILCVSAHWETSGSRVTAMPEPRTIHDFGGFPRQLFEMRYPAPGSPALARLVHQLTGTKVGLDLEWGLDHGTWSVLCRMFPAADVPVAQLSLDRTKPPAFHYQLGRALASLRRRGVLIVGSGNVVHNLGLIRWSGGVFDWAAEFDEAIRRLIVAGDHEAIVDYERLGPSAQLAVPTNEHFLPLLYALGLKEENEDIRFFAEGIAYGSLSMRSLRIG